MHDWHGTIVVTHMGRYLDMAHGKGGTHSGGRFLLLGPPLSQGSLRGFWGGCSPPVAVNTTPPGERPYDCMMQVPGPALPSVQRPSSFPFPTPFHPAMAAPRAAATPMDASDTKGV